MAVKRPLNYLASASSDGLILSKQGSRKLGLNINPLSPNEYDLLPSLVSHVTKIVPRHFKDFFCDFWHSNAKKKENCEHEE